MILHQGNKSIEFTIVNYQYPEKRPSKEGFDYNANWLMCEVKYSDAETNETYKDACVGEKIVIIFQFVYDTTDGIWKDRKITTLLSKEEATEIVQVLGELMRKYQVR